MKNNFLIIAALFLIFLLNLSLTTADTASCTPEIKIINQDPNPVTAGSYVKVVFELSHLAECINGLEVKLNSEYPFSLDPGYESIQSIEKSFYIRDYSSVWDVPYKVRVDDSALTGDYNLELLYHSGTNIDFNSLYSFSIGRYFNITISNSQTNFDAVIQEVSGSDVSIAIANIGKYTANSVVVRIPEQESFRASGIDGQMVGNLESGDYTIVGFSISPKGAVSRNISRTNFTANPQTLSNKLKFDIYYTDNIGERRVVNMTLPLNMGNSSMIGAGGAGNFAGTRKTSSSSWSNWYTLIIILALLAGTYFIHKKYPKQTKDFLNKIKSKIKRVSKKEEKIVHDINKIPDWVKNAKEKEKKK